MEASFENKFFLPCPAVSHDNPFRCACWFSTTLIIDYTNSRSSISVTNVPPTFQIEGFVKYLDDIFVFSCCRTVLKGLSGFAQLALN